MSDMIAVMHGGIVQQFGTPAEVYGRPANLFVAGFIGSPPMNFVSGTLGGGDQPRSHRPISRWRFRTHQRMRRTGARPCWG